MKAVKFIGNQRLEIIEKPIPKAKDGMTVVKVSTSGLCTSDLKMLFSSDHPVEVTPGHEVSGYVVEAADESGKFKKGDRVMVNCHWTCRECEYCRGGDLIFCSDLKCFGFDIDGGHAEYIAVVEGSLRHLPDDISDEEGILIADALGTAYSAVKKLGIKCGEYVGIFGAGPLGHLAALVANSLGGRIVAIDVNSKRLETIKDFGAEYVINPNECDAKQYDIKQEIMKITGGRGLDKAIEIAGVNDTLIMAMDTLKYKGRLVLVGVCLKAEFNPYELIVHKEIELIGSQNSNDYELEEIMEFVRKNRKVNDVITHRFNIDEAENAFELNKKGEGMKIVLKP